MKRTIVLVLGLVLAFTCTAASAQMHSGQGMMGGQGYYGGNQDSSQGMPYGMGYGMGYQRMDPKQVEAYQAVLKKYQDSLGGLMEKIWAKRSLLNAELAQEKVDSKKVLGLADDLGKLMSEACVQHTKMMIEMREKGLPYTGMGMMHGGMMGGSGMGYGMMGPGMMGPGMMGGSGHMWGRGGMW